MILYPFMGQLTEDEIGHANFQQGRASAHMAHVSMPLLHDVFSDQLISRDIWPLRSPDLTPMIVICGQQ